MAYCTAQEVLDMLKEDMMNFIIGNEYIEDKDEKIEKIMPIAEQAVQSAVCRDAAGDQ